MGSAKSNGWGGEKRETKKGRNPPVTPGFSLLPSEECTRVSVKKQFRVGGRSLPSHLWAPAIPGEPGPGFLTSRSSNKKRKKQLHVTDHECWYLRKFLSKVKKEAQVSGVILRRTFGHH